MIISFISYTIPIINCDINTDIDIFDDGESWDLFAGVRPREENDLIEPIEQIEENVKKWYE